MKIKLSVCADYHLHPQYPIDTSGLYKILERAKENKVDAMVHCGDFIIDIANNKKAFDDFFSNDAGIPAFGCYGNHELELTDSIETLNKYYGVENSYYYRDIKGFRIVVTDTNYFEIDGEVRRYPGFSVGGPSWDYDHNMLGDEQLKWLRETLMSSPYPCIILSHILFARKVGNNDRDNEKVQKILHEVNEKHPGRILLCINGHYHSNSVQAVDNIAFFNVNAAYMGYWQPQKHDLYPKEFSDKYESANNGAFFKDPLNAIVTVDSDGTIDIEGMETSYIYDVTPLKIGFGPREDVVPYISDAHIVLK